MRMPKLLAVVTFEGLVELGRASGAPLHGEKKMPWSFNLFGKPITHENDDLYIVCMPNTDNLRMTRDKQLAFWDDQTCELRQLLGVI